MKKLLIFGSAGMAGHMITYYFLSLKNYNVIDLSFPKKLNSNSILLNIEDSRAVEDVIKSNKPDIVINCIGVLIKFSEENPDKAIYINSYFPHFLEKLGREYNFKIIHLSTDCVFSGEKGAYRENDLKDGEGFYAQSKAMGEIINEKDLTFRTSIIGPELKEWGEGLFHWFMTQKGVVKGFSRVFWTGITTLELAKAVEAAVVQNLTGLYHLVPQRKISKFELLKLIKKIWKKDDLSIEEFKGKSLDKSLINTRTDFNYIVKGYKEMLNELHDWMDDHKDLYKNNY